MSYPFILVNFKLYRFLFNSTTNYDEVNLTFNNNLNSDNVIFIIKEKSNENYFMSIEWYQGNGNLYSITYNEVMLFQLSYNFETNSCFSLNNLTKSNELSSLTVGQNSTNNEKGIYSIHFLNWIF